MPTFIFDTDQVIKAEVSSAYLFEKEAKGTIHLRWFAKKVREFIFLTEVDKCIFPRRAVRDILSELLLCLPWIMVQINI